MISRDVKNNMSAKYETIKLALDNKLKSKNINGKFYVPTKLLGVASTKTIKGLKKGVSTYIMYLSPSSINSKGINLCSHSTYGCVESCLFSSGRGSFSSVELARVNKTEYFIHNKQAFLTQLVSEIRQISLKHSKMSKNEIKRDSLGRIMLTKEFAIRLNGTSDILWAKIKIDSENGKNIFEVFPDVQFYDYTKVPNIVKYSKPFKNYYVAFSHAEGKDNISKEFLNNGTNVSAVFFPSLPNEFLDYPIFDGDDSDLIFKYPDNHIIGLNLKVPKKTKSEIKSFIAKSVKSGFVSLVIDGKVIPTNYKNFEKAYLKYISLNKNKVSEASKFVDEMIETIKGGKVTV